MDLNPTNNSTQTGTLTLEFTLGNIQVAQPGDIVIKIPQHIFYDREGNGVGSFNIPLKESPAEEGATGFNYKIEDGYIVMTNYRAISDSYIFTTGLKYDYLPLKVKNGYTKTFNASVEVLSGGVSKYKKDSNDLSLKANTDARLSSLTKRQYKKYDNWPTFLSNKPADADDYFYVVWEVYNSRTYATQPYVISFNEKLSDGGEVIGYSTTSSESSSYFTPCNTNEFNSNYKVTIGTPGTSSSNSTSSGNYNYTYIYTKYPKSAIPAAGSGQTKLFKNDLTATLTGTDGVTNNITANAEYEYKATNSTYPGNLYSASKSMSPWLIYGGINKLENGSKITVNTTLSGSSRIHSITNDGTGSARLELVDTDMRFSSPSAALTRGEDYNFTGFKISSLYEYDYSINSESGAWNTVTNSDYANHEKIDIYYQTKGNNEWKFGGSIKRTAVGGYEYKNSTGTVVSLGSDGYVALPEEAASVKAVHNSKYFYSSVSVAFQMNILPSATVLNAVKDRNNASLYNYAKLEVFDNNNNPNNVVGSYGCSDYAYIYRLSPSGYMYKSTYNQTTDVAKGQESALYDIVQYNTTSYLSTIYSLDEIKEMGIVPEQTKGVFYDLLPAGTSVDTSSIKVKTYHASGTSYGTNCTYTLNMVDNWRGSGRTMMIVYATAPSGGNYYVTSNTLSSGFRLNYKLDYTWSNIRDYGKSAQNDVAYYSESGNLPSGYADTGTYFPSPVKDYFADLDGDGNTDPTKTNVMYSRNTTTFNPITASEAGFTKTVSEGGMNDFAKNSAAEALGTYTYKLRYETASNVNAKGVVMYDVLEGAHGSNANWKGEFVSADISQPASKGIDAKVYYSTAQGLNPNANEADRDLSDGSKWSTSKPANNNEITAVAVDLTKTSGGGEYTFGAGESAVANIIMKAPANYQEHAGKFAYNNAVIDSTMIDVNQKETRSIEDTYPTKLALKASGIAISKKANPASGTKTSPTDVAPDDTIKYSVTVANTGSAEAKSDVKVKDIIKDGLKIDADNIKYYLNDDSSNAALVAGSSDVSVNIDGQKLEFTAKNLPAGGSITFVIPTQVDKESLNSYDPYVIDNTAYLTGFNGEEYALKSETTYHQTQLVKPQTVDLEKLEIHLDSDPVSGTKEDPTMISQKDNVNYDITVKNKSDDLTYMNVKVKDTIPKDLKINMDEIKYYFGDDSTKAVLVSSTDEISLKSDKQTLEFTIKKFKPGQTVHFIIPTQESYVKTKSANSKNTVVLMQNTAYITEASGYEASLESETTYHGLAVTGTQEVPDDPPGGGDKPPRDKPPTKVTGQTKTGDNNTGLFVIMLAGALIGAAGLTAYRKKAKHIK